MTYTNNIKGWMAPVDLQWLYDTAGKMDTIVEVGSWMGKSTHALLSGCHGIVTAVDHFKGTEWDMEHYKKAIGGDVYDIFMKNVGHFKNLKVLRMSSAEAAKEFSDKSIDMVFIDGDHSYDGVKNDLLLWRPKTKKLLCGHDWGSYPGVQKAVLEVFGFSEINTKGGDIWTIKM